MESIYNYSLPDLEEFLLSIGEKKYRAKQIYDWLYVKKVSSLEEMTNIKKETLENIKKYLYMPQIKLLKKESDSDVSKYLFELEDKHVVEAVLMRQVYGNSVCISTQVGCNMGCAFCESGRLKKIRNLSSSEIVMQILNVEIDLKERVSHVVVMGIGEPFDNFDNLCKFIEIINNPHGLNIGSRHITVSTCGIVPKIYELIKFPYQINLAISLHAPNNKLRTSIMKINQVYNIEQIMEAVREYIKSTNRRVTFEYIMLSDINDTKDCAIELSNLLRGLNCYVNLIPYNETNNLTFKRSNGLSIMSFYDILKKRGINVTVRKEFGSKISAACGQLRAKQNGE